MAKHETSNSVALVSGAASGIGRHMAQVLAREGYRLIVTDVNAEGLSALTDSLHVPQDRVLAVPLDVRDAAGWEALVERAEREMGELSLMLNVAGTLTTGHAADLAIADIDRQVDVNVKGLMYATRAGVRAMLKRGRGHILNVASIAGLSHVPGLSVYCGTKHAVRGFTLSVAHEVKDRGVDVTVFCPDAAQTPMLDQQVDRPEAAMTFAGGRGLTLEEVEKAMLRAIKDRPLEVVVEVPGSFRAIGARLANAMPPLTRLALGAMQRKGQEVQQRSKKG